MTAVLAYAAEVSGVLSFPLAAVAAWVPMRKWLRERRNRRYQPRHRRGGPPPAPLQVPPRRQP